MNKVPYVEWPIRVRDENPDPDNPNPYHWETLTSDDVFKGRRVVVFSLPGAFTPTCSTYQLPGFEKMADQFREKGVDDIYCLSVNDTFVMNAWARQQGLTNVKVIPDGNGEFTLKMGMVVNKFNLGFGARSWRYVMIVNDGVIEHVFEEPGKQDQAEDDPYGETSPENVFKYV